MSQISLFDIPRYTVSELTRKVRQLLESEPALADAWVQGEISNFSRPTSGHLYFTLKDSGASLRCVVWKGDAIRLRGIQLKDGLSVEVHGKIAVYEPAGQYQLIIDVLRPAGEGALFAEFLRLKAMLESEGLFAQARKRPIPNFPRSIGIVTSPTGAALRDMINILRRRLPLASVVLAPAPVQGSEAPSAIVAALQALNNSVRPDVILLARGGGSIEDLWAFNDERVVRAVVASRSPVISGVGHETDFTLVDFASDMRAPTPTAAAELATPVTIQDLSGLLRENRITLNDLLQRQVDELKANLENMSSALRYFSPARRLETEYQMLDDVLRRGTRALEQRLKLEAAHLSGAANRLKSLSPLSVLGRGYAVITSAETGEIIRSADQAPQNTNLSVRLASGSLRVNVQESFSEET